MRNLAGEETSLMKASQGIKILIPTENRSRLLPVMPLKIIMGMSETIEEVNTTEVHMMWVIMRVITMSERIT
jgi:hypothetical protein